MLCQRCKKNIATFNYVEIINGEKFESHLCASCYADLCGGLHSKSGSDLWTGLFDEPARREKTCPVCGASYSDYERTGLLGCPNCYDVFRKELLPSIQRIQGKTNHVGKADSNTDEFGLHRKLNALQEELERALKERRYSDAGKLNKEISQITKILFGKGDGNE